MTDKQVKQNGVIWLDKTGLSVYLDNKQFLRLNFTPDCFSNLEIVDRVKLENLVAEFIKKNNLSYLSFILIMTSDVLFEKDWVIPQTEVQKKEEIDFIDSIPFENTIIHTWIKEDKKKLIATNQDFIFFIGKFFEKNSGHLIGAFPYSLFGANVRNESVKEIWKAINNFKHDNLVEISNSQLPIKLNNDRVDKTDKKKSPLSFLIIVFVVLLGILGFLMFKR